MPLDSDGIRRLVETIDETPETVIPIHLLTHGTCKAYAVGDPASSDAVIVQSDSLREEPFGLGGDAQGLWDLLRHLDDWTVVDVSPEVAPRLGALIRDATGKRVCYYGDVYHTLTAPAPLIDEPAVRELTRDDMGLLEAAGVDGADFRGGLPALLEEGAVAGRGGGRQDRGHGPDGRHNRPLRRHRSQHGRALARAGDCHGCGRDSRKASAGDGKDPGLELR